MNYILVNFVSQSALGMECTWISRSRESSRRRYACTSYYLRSRSEKDHWNCRRLLLYYCLSLLNDLNFSLTVMQLADIRTTLPNRVRSDWGTWSYNRWREVSRLISNCFAAVFVARRFLIIWSKWNPFSRLFPFHTLFSFQRNYSSRHSMGLGLKWPITCSAIRKYA